MGFVEQSTELINSDRKKWRFHWQCGEYKFYNIYLAHWFQTEFGQWVDYVDKEHDVVKQQLLNIESIDEDVDYDLIHLQRLRDNNKKLALLFSGGYDSTYLFKKAVDNNIFFDKILTNAVGSWDEPFSAEQKYNVFPWLEEYPDAFGELVKHCVSVDEYKEFVKDPNFIFSDPCVSLPKFVVNQWINCPWEDEYKYIRCEAHAQIVYKDGRWYATLVNKTFSGNHGQDLSSFWVDPENIISFMKNALKIRKFCIEKYGHPDSELEFYKVYNREIFDLLNLTELKNPSAQGRKYTVTRDNKMGYTRNDKDKQLFNWFLEISREDILFDILNGDNYFYKVCNFTYQDQADVVHDSGKFPWFIDLDTFELFRQSDVFK